LKKKKIKDEKNQLTKNKAKACELGLGGLAYLSLKTPKSTHLG
jgi:hypothetical protein